MDSSTTTITINESLPKPLPSPPPKPKTLQWWLSVSLNIFFLLAGQTAATLLGNLYYSRGGDSKWLSTIVQTAAFPLLYIPLFLLPHPTTTTPTPTTDLHRPPSMAKLALIYIFIGLLIAGDDLMYSYGLLYLPVSTYALICATQLAFNAVFSYFINHQKFTHLIFNSVVLLTFSAALLGVNSDSEGSDTKPSAGKYAIGFACTLGASAAYSLILSLMQFSFENIYTAFVATSASVVGLFASGEWRTLKGEMEGFEKGKVSYVMILVWTAVAWQVASVGVHYIDDAKAKKARSQVPLLLEEEKESLAFPILLIPLILSFKTKTNTTRPPLKNLSLLYASLGLLVGFDNLLYSYGLLYLPLSTYSLVCATQLAFNAVFSRFLNGQRFTHLVLNSVVLLSVSASLLGVRAGSEAGNARIPPGKYAVGFACTLGASAAYSLLLSLMQLSFERVMRGETYRVVLEMQVGQDLSFFS
ncbi:putative purine permease 11 [Acorus calamus]|uniref:Probable purine permease n=1 Tax=Acorus calamus TaxID=4465 RepID=A0AAV9FMQ1_ACOCL|nr:putative purine permease 11 [Acorus calamus]